MMTPRSSIPSVLVIGARRAQQGIGEFVARSFANAGARVAAIVGTTARTLLEARDALDHRYGISCNGYVNLSEALEVERPDIVAICSPFLAHRRQLRLAAAAGAHCLCEKPMWWDDSMSQDLVRETDAIVDEFESRDRHLALVTQWPITLETYWSVYPSARGEPIRTLDMLMGPTHFGPRMVLDAAPHVISLLQALVGTGTVKAEAVTQIEETRTLRIEFEYLPAVGESVAVGFELRETPAPPRPAGYAINGRWVDRVIELPAYEMFFEGGGRRVALPDPLELLVGNFLGAIENGRKIDRTSLVEGMRGLGRLHQAARATFVART